MTYTIKGVAAKIIFPFTPYVFMINRGCYHLWPETNPVIVNLQKVI